MSFRQPKVILGVLIAGIVLLVAMFRTCTHLPEPERFHARTPAIARQTATPERTPVPENRQDTEPLPEYVTETDSFTKNDTLDAVLRRHGIGAQERFRIAEIIGGVADTRRIRQGSAATFFKASDSAELLRLEIRIALKQKVEAWKDDTGSWNAKIVGISGILRDVSASGVIDSSFWETAVANNVPPEMILEIAEILGWQIDFATDIRKGDAFRVLYKTEVFPGGDVHNGPVEAVQFVNMGKEFWAFRFETESSGVEYYDASGTSVRRNFLKSPLKYKYISSGFSHRRFHPILKIYRPHLGVDFAAPSGTPVSALGDGVVVFRGWKGGYGRYVQIKHGNEYETCYGHLSRFGKGIKKGVHVKQGQIIGYVGASGMATGPHLDFRVKHRGRFINPLKIKTTAPPPVPQSLRNAFEDVKATYLKLLEIKDEDAIPSISS